MHALAGVGVITPLATQVGGGIKMTSPLVDGNSQFCGHFMWLFETTVKQFQYRIIALVPMYAPIQFDSDQSVFNQKPILPCSCLLVKGIKGKFLFMMRPPPVIPQGPPFMMLLKRKRELRPDIEMSEDSYSYISGNAAHHHAAETLMTLLSPHIARGM